MTKAEGVEVIGIAAPTCAGKTSLVSELLTRMHGSAAALSFDEYDLYPVGSEAMERELAEPKISNWEDPSLFDVEQFVADLGRIVGGKSFTLQTRSRESLAVGEQERVFVPAKTNIVEGVFVLHDTRARALFDLSLFIDIPLDVMVERRLATLRPLSSSNPWDNPEYVRGPMVEGTKRFVLPQREEADVILDGLRPTVELADQVMQLLGQQS